MSNKSAQGDSPELSAARERLKLFLGRHPRAKIVEIDVESVRSRAILGAWGDSSLAFTVPDDDAAFDEAFNSVILSERFTALYHVDRRALEVIWTAYPKNDEDIVNRSFSYTYDGQKHKCAFARSSDRLLAMAYRLRTLKMSFTSFRNLQSFYYYTLQERDGVKIRQAIAEPTSFWIDNLDWDVDRIIEFANNLNFYLSYYDSESPTVVIHPVADQEKPHARSRYISGKFPKNIVGKRLDNNLLSFWEASSGGDPARRFQYYYRIIEYASFSYLESSARIAVRRILGAPDVGDDIATTTDRLMAAFQLSKLDEYARFSQLLADTVTPAVLWGEIKQNIPAFSKEVRFDGGFTLKPIIAASAREATFAPKGVELFTKAVRDIRNALSHGRDYKSATVIVPTQRNLKALQPWVHLIAVAAGQVVLFRDVT